MSSVIYSVGYERFGITPSASLLTQTKFVQVMFSQVFVCPQGGLCPGGVSVQGGPCLGGLCPGGFSVRETPPVWLRVDGTHPTGMHSCYEK